MKIELAKEHLIECRGKAGITKQEAARRMDMSQPAYLRYESGERTPSLHIIRTMADVLQTSVEYLTGETDDPSPTSFTVRNNSEPELFNIILEYRSASRDTQIRLLEYARRITCEKNETFFHSESEVSSNYAFPSKKDRSDESQ